MVSNFLQSGTTNELNAFYIKLFNDIPDLLFEFIITRDNTYQFPFVSKSVNEIFEITSEHFCDSDKFLVYNRIVESDRFLFFDSLLHAKRSLSRWECEFRVVLPKRGLRWLKMSAKPELYDDDNIGFYGRVVDVTDLKEQEIKLKISEERFKFALEASTAGVWDWNLASNTVFYSSQSMKILEQDSLDIFDNPERWDEIVHRDDLEKYYADIHEHFENKTPFYENCHRVLTSSGKYKWILDRGKVIERDANGKPLRVLGTHTDISAQKEKELELVKTMELYSQQNSRLLNFSHIVSHNLNTQAGNIKTILDFIESDDEEDIMDEMLDSLRTVSNDLNETIANLTQLVQIESNANIPILSLNLSQYLTKTLDLIKHLKNYNEVSIINEIDAEACVDFNPAYLESVFLNFTTNAIKYADKNRAIEIKYTYALEGGKKTLSISDNGLGIDLEKYGSYLFGMYKTFHKHEESRGLGLHLTRNQIESMNGTVSVTSEVGVGTTFKITFNDILIDQKAKP